MRLKKERPGPIQPGAFDDLQLRLTAQPVGGH